jgi:AraC-like DNA-binding protein
MDELKNITITKVQHPGLRPELPFNLVPEYKNGAMPDFAGDMHYALQFCIILHGGMELIFDEFRRKYTAGEAWWTMFWEPHAFRFTEKRNFAIAVNIDFDHLGNCDPFGSANWVLPFVTRANLRYCPQSKQEKETFTNTGKTLYKLWNSKTNSLWKIRSWLLIHELISIASDNILTRQQKNGNSGLSENFKKIKPSIDLVRKGLGRYPSIDEGAKSCNLSSSRFSHLFREAMGVSFGKFAARARLAATTMDLKKSTMTIEDIADKWGFVDHSHYLKSFKKLYGCTPRQYQKNKQS